ncbi:MAG: glucokinase [Gammaproteobacteria bacterium]|nr:glucokinase [Gammaproteobacteria bacterium]
MDLIADIGATNGRFALVDDKGRILAVERFKLADFASVDDVLRTYLAERRASDQPKRAVLAVAAPIVGDEVSMVNRGWRFSQSELARTFGLAGLQVVNDFAAIAWALPHLTPEHVKQIGGGSPVRGTPIAALGPGSGLGVSSVVPCADGWAVAQGEGGHVTLPAMNDREAEVIDMIRDELGHCSAERILSGPGLVRLYQALARLAGRGTPTVSPYDVTALAEQGEPLARKTREMFFAMLGTVAGDLALTLGARGGIYIAGGIVPNLVGALSGSGFRGRFEDKGRYRWYMESIPTYVITEPLPAFIGLRRLLGYR